MSEIQKIPALNGIRALSVVMVVASHTGRVPLIPGGFGVTVFFFLSGYLITTLLLNEYKKNKVINMRFFFVRRLLRLSPAFLVSISLTYFLSSLNLIAGNATLVGMLAQVFYFANYFDIFFDGAQYTASGTGVYWSLAVEEHFYFLYPFILVFLLNRLSVKGIVYSFFTLIFLVLAWRFFLYSNVILNENRILFATDTRIDSILFGCLLGVVKNPINFLNNRGLRLRDYCLLFSALFIIFISFIFRDEWFRLVPRFTIQGFGLMVLFYYAIAFSQHKMFSFLNWKILNIIGVYSYSIYLSHVVIIKLIKINSPILYESFMLLPTVFICSFIYAFIIFKLVEKPMYYFRKKFIA